ncbi:MAG: putative bifunctional diguanylate cyclase/phosphodiesterase, partial [Solirubrobacteraceae bacterium]
GAGLCFGLPAGGELHAVIAVPERLVTDDARSALEALAREATLALEAVTLTERNARRRSEERFSSLVRHASDIVGILGADGSLRYVSQSVRRVLGYDADAMVGTQLLDYVHPDDRAHALAVLTETAGEDPARPVDLEFRARDAAGEWRHLETLATNLTGDPSVAGVVINARDVSDRKAFERQLSHDALHDRLTGLANRALFFDRLAQALAHKQRVASCNAVLFLDIDDFKGVNDGLGHAGGDEVLREVARRISRCIRASDSAARLGGDEFAVLLNDVTSGVHAADIAERIMRAISEPILLVGHEVLVHASVGIALDGDGEHAIGADAILRNADAAMYLAKGRGKGCYHVFEAAMHDAAVQRLRLKADLRRAIDEGELFVEYQPIVRLDGEEISGVEALVRWQHPERGIVPPGEFIPLAEESGLIVQLGEVVLRTACRDVGALHAIDPSAPPLAVSVNISARELQRRQIVDTVARTLKELAFPPASLIMELTESVMMHDMDLAVERMQELRTLGVRLAIDDFGTGYSSLNYVRKFPIDLLKIDRSFIQDINEGGEISGLTASIVGLAQILKLEPVAEGIENADQLARLRELNCTFGQGYHLHRPMRVDAVAALLRSRAAAVTG